MRDDLYPGVQLRVYMSGAWYVSRATEGESKGSAVENEEGVERGCDTRNYRIFDVTETLVT